MTTPGPTSFTETDRTRLRRRRTRGTFDRDAVFSILDEALVAHVGFITPAGPVVLPMTFARLEDRLYLHGAAGNAMLTSLAGGADVCVTVTLLDGLVLARSAFHHSMNYRSVVMFGQAVEIEDVDEKGRAMAAMVDRMAPGRSEEARPPAPAELRATLVVSVPILEVSAKVRTGGPIDDPEDLTLPVWAGHIPMRLVRGEPVSAPEAPGSVQEQPLVVPHEGQA